MLKFLIIMTLVVYLIYRASRFLFRIFIIGVAGSQTFGRQPHPRHKPRPKGGNVSIDYIPGEVQKGATSGYDGGEYVDYEEIK